MLIILSIILALFTAVIPAQAQSSNDLPGSFDIIMLAGADYLLALKTTDATGAAIDITGYTYAAQFRSAAAPAGILFATYSTVTTDAAAGKSRMSLSKSQTAQLSGKSGVWDLLQIDAMGKATFLRTGRVVVKATATRWP